MSQSTVRTHKGHLIRTSHIAQWDVIATHKRPCSGGTGAILDPQVTIKWDVTTLDKAISCLPRHLDPLRIGGGVTTPSFRPKTRFGGSIQAEDIVRWGVWLGRKIYELNENRNLVLNKRVKARLILIFTTNTNRESVAYRSFRPSEFEARGVRKVTTGITGLWQPSVYSDVAF
ncbi:hypothetical protein YC2023_108035 [Brassica napus]